MASRQLAAKRDDRGGAAPGAGRGRHARGNRAARLGPPDRGPDELAGWFAGEVAAPFLRATAPAALGDWLTDRRARRPSGKQARGVYRDPTYHYPNFRVILAEPR